MLELASERFRNGKPDVRESQLRSEPRVEPAREASKPIWSRGVEGVDGQKRIRPRIKKVLTGVVVQDPVPQTM